MRSTINTMNYPEAHEFETTLAAVCMQAYRDDPDRVLLRYKIGQEPEVWTVSNVMQRALDYAKQLLALKVKPGDAVAVMLDNHPDHVAVMIALCLTGAIWLPLDRRFTAANVRRVLAQVDAAVVIAEPAYVETLRDGGFDGKVILRLEANITSSHTENQIHPDPPLRKEGGYQQNQVLTGTPPPFVKGERGGFKILAASSSIGRELQQGLEAIVSATATTPDDTRALLFTSGTTGPPKGVVVTERMYIASARFCGHASDANPDAVFYLWEPLSHIGGAQIIPMAFLSGCTIAMTEKFSVSRFWPEVIESAATRMHYLGGVIELLLRQEPAEHDRQHKITLGFGAGASEQISREFTQRFGIPLREVYGMTEASSFTTMNHGGPLNSIGKVLPDFDLRLTDNDGRSVATGETGEITLQPKRRALVTPHYYRNERATHDAFRAGYFRTGDLAYQDQQGYLYFVGRQKELIRCKGENISPWEVESVFKQHAAVLEVAVVGVESDITEQDIAAFVRLTPMERGEHEAAIDEIRSLLTRELAPFQQPRYIVEVEQFPKTPSERIEKHKLDVSAEVLVAGWV